MKRVICGVLGLACGLLLTAAAFLSPTQQVQAMDSGGGWSDTSNSFNSVIAADEFGVGADATTEWFEWTITDTNNVKTTYRILKVNVPGTDTEPPIEHTGMRAAMEDAAVRGRKARLRVVSGKLNSATSY